MTNNTENEQIKKFREEFRKNLFEKNKLFSICMSTKNQLYDFAVLGVNTDQFYKIVPFNKRNHTYLWVDKMKLRFFGRSPKSTYILILLDEKNTTYNEKSIKLNF